MTKRKHSKRRYRLNPQFTRFIIYFLVFLALGIYGVTNISKAVADMKYKESNEYKLLSLGYSETDTKKLLEILNSEDIQTILDEGEYNELYPQIINQKYFLVKNYKDYVAYKVDNEDIPYEKVIAIVNVKAANGWYSITENTNIADGNLMIVNKFYSLSSSYSPEDLENVSLQYAYADNKASAIVIQAFEQMYYDVLDNLNVHLMVNSSYRSYEDQEEIYNDYKNVSLKYADSYAARPGYSEHQTGLALDITSLEHKNQKEFTSSIEYEWLKNNAHKYGFILRYPEGKEDITGYNNESWHFRYVGIDVATQIFNEQITFDEYYAYYLDK